MSFSDQLRAFAASTTAKATAIHQGVAVMAYQSWVEGSSVTGAPELPIAQGDAPTVGKLRRGVRLTYPDPNTALVYTTVEYAEDVEHNLRGVQFHSGGAHGWKLTVTGFPRIVETVTRRISGYR